MTESKVVIVDIETQSLLNLKTIGAARYVRHPSTRLLSLVAKSENQTHVWIPHAPSVEILNAIVSVGSNVPVWLQRFVDEDYLFVGHNCDSFDAPFLKHHYSLAPRWRDTMPAARAHGLPGGLDRIADAIGRLGKNKDGQKVMHLLCAAKVKDGRVVYPLGTPALWILLLKYNTQDVLLTEALYEEIKDRPQEIAILATDRAINARGIYIDTQWVKDLLCMWDDVEKMGGDRLADLTGGALTRETAGSVSKVRDWLAMRGLQLKSVARKELERILDNPEETIGLGATYEDVNAKAVDGVDVGLVVEVLRLRQQLTRAMKGKIEKVAEVIDEDHRVRDTLVYWGAGPGRWTGRGLQPQNMSKGVGIDVEAILKGPRTTADIIAKATEYTQRTEKVCNADDALVSLVRPIFAAPVGSTLGIVDYNAVEARGAAWLFGEQWMLDCFADPKRDIYCEYWKRITGDEITKKDSRRNVAKVCVLGLQYGMSHRKLSVYAASAGIDLAKLGVTAEQLVADYRRVCPAIKAGWREIGNAMDYAIRHGFASTCHDRVSFRSSGSDHLYCELPSRRILTYRNCRYIRGVPGYCRVLGLPPFETDILRYRSVRGYDVDLYATKATENIVQGFCRDFLAEALVKLEETTPASFHVHDEAASEFLVTRAEGDLNAMCQVMSTPPDWAPNFPLRVEGFTCAHYVKSPWSNSFKADYMKGKAC